MYPFTSLGIKNFKIINKIPQTNSMCHCFITCNGFYFHIEDATIVYWVLVHNKLLWLVYIYIYQCQKVFIFKKNSFFPFFYSIESFLAFFHQCYLSIFNWFWISIYNLFWFVFYEVITVLNKRSDNWIVIKFCYKIVEILFLIELKLCSNRILEKSTNIFCSRFTIFF